MEQHIEVIRLAIATDATEEARVAGIAACNEILQALQPALPVPQTNMANPSEQLAQLAGALRGVPMDQLLDLAITKLRTMVPATSPRPTLPGFAVPFVPVPRS